MSNSRSQAIATTIYELGLVDSLDGPTRPLVVEEQLGRHLELAGQVVEGWLGHLAGVAREAALQSKNFSSDAEYQDLGLDWVRREDAEAKKRRLIRQLEALGLAVTVEQVAACVCAGRVFLSHGAGLLRMTPRLGGDAVEFPSTWTYPQWPDDRFSGPLDSLCPLLAAGDKPEREPCRLGRD